MYVRLEEVLGARVAATVMEHLPPVGWADVATKRDLDAFQAAMTSDLDGMRAATARDLEALGLRFERECERVRAEMRREFNRLLLGLIPTYVALLGLVVTVAKLS